MPAPRQPNKQLSKEIADILDVSLRSGTDILRAVLAAITAGLSRGDRVYVRGFGTFKFIERTHRPTPNNVLTNDRAGQPIFASGLQRYRPRRVLVFEPSVPLQAMLNMDTPNSEERRSLQSWRKSPCAS